MSVPYVITAVVLYIVVHCDWAKQVRDATDEVQPAQASSTSSTSCDLSSACEAVHVTQNWLPPNPPPSLNRALPELIKQLVLPALQTKRP